MMGSSSAMKQSQFRLRVKAVLSAVLPAEWHSAGDVLQEMKQAQMPRRDERLKARVWLAIQFVLGAVVAAIAYAHISADSMKDMKDFMAALLALSALVVGFVVTLMLFTGGLSDMSSLSLEQVKGHAIRTKYLLVSQATTLGSALVLGVVSLVWVIFSAVGGSPWVLQVIFSVAGGFLFITVLRTVLLPIQIFELHSAALRDKVEAKAKEVADKYKQNG